MSESVAPSGDAELPGARVETTTALEDAPAVAAAEGALDYVL